MVQRTQRSRPRSLLGLLLIVIGLFLTLDKLGLASDLRPFFWPVLIALLGGFKLFSGERSSGTFLMGLGIVLGWVAYDPELSLGQLIRDYWPMLLVLAGLVMVLRSVFGDPESGVDKGPRLTIFGLFSTPQRKIASKAFQGGDLMAVLGGIDLDLTESELHPEGAAVGLFTWWGGMKIRVPRHWRVEMRVFSLMGASEDNARQEGGNTGPVLILQGLVVMGGVEVTN